ncbi:hypothetical protein HK103_004863 [Boothiomyces macroporosus]|uniref:BD-FAE-like domain-containing protein n=1 Tax=Boothiomyces macroporosus TaxID=261099 RepID=A0AAD5Y3T3_9FUNG|nr:hypothetical protein HK103_004863 [Boothiomyces macroporosus]
MDLIKSTATAPYIFVKSSISTYAELIERLRYHYSSMIPFPKSWVSLCIFLMVSPLLFHLLFPLWISLLSVPCFISWTLYLAFAQHQNPNRVKILHIAIPTIPLSPIRIFQVNRAFFNYLSKNIYGPPMVIFKTFIWSTWNKKNKQVMSKGRIAKNINFGSKFKDTTLDVYESTFENRDHVSYLHSKENHRPVIIFIHGGGWNSGHKNLYSPIGYNLTQRGFVTVIPNYTLWPKATISEMVADIDAAIKWTLRNIRKYGGDASNITLVGHAAGAHLCMTSVLNYAKRACESHSDHSSAIEKYAQSHVHKLMGVVLLNGIYDIPQHLNFEKIRGIEELSCMSRLFENKLESFKYWSPTEILKRSARFIEKGDFQQFIPHNIMLVHAKHDDVVPFESSKLLYDSLSKMKLENLSLVAYNGTDHYQYLYDLFLAREEFFEHLDRFYRNCRNIKRYKRWLTVEGLRNPKFVPITFAEFVEGSRTHSSQTSSDSDLLR